MFNIVLLNPKIPQNVGSIGRSCVCSDSKLHIIGPTPIEFDEKRLRRAGLDYWQSLEFFYYENLESFLSDHPISQRHFFFTSKTDKIYFEANFCEEDFLWFGAEDTGLPSDLIKANIANALTIPMKGGFRSLNLSNVVTTVIYEGIRQNLAIFKQ